VVMTQGLDTGLSPIPPGFPSFGRDVKLSVPATYLVVVMLEALARPENF
jgi:hypothetical protein